MGYQESLKAMSDKASARLADVQADVDAFASLDSEISSEVRAKEDAAYDLGMKDAQAAAGNPDGKVFSLEEANAMRDEALKPVQDELAEQKLKVADLQAKVDAMPSDLEAIKKEAGDAAVNAKLDELSAEYEKKQVAESAEETGFGDLLKRAQAASMRVR